MLKPNNSLKAVWHDQVKENSGLEAQPSHPALCSVPKLGEEDTAGEGIGRQRNKQEPEGCPGRTSCYCASQMELSLSQTEG